MQAAAGGRQWAVGSRGGEAPGRTLQRSGRVRPVAVRGRVAASATTRRSAWIGRWARDPGVVSGLTARSEEEAEAEAVEVVVVVEEGYHRAESDGAAALEDRMGLRSGSHVPAQPGVRGQGPGPGRGQAAFLLTRQRSGSRGTANPLALRGVRAAVPAAAVDQSSPEERLRPRRGEPSASPTCRRATSTRCRWAAAAVCSIRRGLTVRRMT